MKERAENKSEEELTRTVREVLSKLRSEDVDMISAKKECIAIYFRCRSFESLTQLWSSCVNGEITQMFKPIEHCLREMQGCEHLELEVILTEDEFVRCIEKMGKLLTFSSSEKQIM